MRTRYGLSSEKNSINTTVTSLFRRKFLSLCGALLLLPIGAMAQPTDWPAIEAAARKDGNDAIGERPADPTFQHRVFVRQKHC